jgi:hypothetical protein
MIEIDVRSGDMMRAGMFRVVIILPVVSGGLGAFSGAS